MSVSINGTGGLTFSDSSVQSTAATGFGFKNRIINGAMMIDVRNSGNWGYGNNVYTLDRWLAVSDTSGKWAFQQNSGSVTPPAGFKNYYGCVSSSSYSPISTDYFGPQQRIEGYNVADLGWGTANAAPVTISFWVRSSLTGTFGGSLLNNAQDRCYPFSYTITSANTWEYKTITVAGDTTGTWLTDNGAGLKLHFSLGAGSSRVGTANAWTGTANVFAPSGAVNVVGTNGATFYITGVQLEKGSTATSYDYRPYGTELALCQRYYQQIGAGNAIPLGVACMSNASRADLTIPLKVTMRSSPSITSASGSNYFNMYKNGDTFFTAFSQGDMNPEIINIRPNSISGTAGVAGYMVTNNASAYIGISAEL